MPDIIRLLPDAVANQIAAGEVVQRPASAVKELLENAVDAGASSIQLIIKDSGKTLIQIIDNGCGMSETDARMSFERHATSKIRSADDLFAIRTMGFRGEALASIAAIAQVELKTRRHEDELGTSIAIEGAEVKHQEPTSCTAGTSISIKNLFFNVPARRNFLKSNSVEARHIIEEFERVALAHPEIAMSLHQNGLEVFQLQKSNLRQRIVSVFGNSYNERLVPVQEETTLLNIIGFVGKPDFAKRTRGEQFLFVNKRFIKDAYLHHAIQNAFEELLPRECYASYWLYLDIDPKKIDVNIHPTKTEIKFEDERAVYSIMRAAVKRSLGQYSVAPALDFEQEKAFDIPYSMHNAPVNAPAIKINPDYNPFATETKQKSTSYISSSSKINASGWENMYKGLKHVDEEQELQAPQATAQPLLENSWQQEFKNNEAERITFQLANQYIVSQLANGIVIIDQQTASERILYERYSRQLQQHVGPTQQELFPQTLQFTSSDFSIINEMIDDIRSLGFDLREFGKNTFVLHGTPADVTGGSEAQTIESLLEQFKNLQSHLKLDRRESLARAMAKNAAVKTGKSLSQKEMKNMIDALFSCEKPYLSIEGKSTMVLVSEKELRERLGKSN